MTHSAAIEKFLRLSPVMPVVTVSDPTSAADLARALVRGGIRVIEVTLRTPVALRAIEVIAREVPEITVGAGTVQVHCGRLSRTESTVEVGVQPAGAAEYRRAARPWAGASPEHDAGCTRCRRAPRSSHRGEATEQVRRLAPPCRRAAGGDPRRSPAGRGSALATERGQPSGHGPRQRP